MTSDIDELKRLLGNFTKERDWSKYHSPKNLALAICSEAGELAHLFRWLSEHESSNLNEETLVKVKHEISDIFIFLILMSESIDADLVSDAKDKIQLNAKKYQSEKQSFGAAGQSEP